jgi:hypothetical protein
MIKAHAAVSQVIDMRSTIGCSPVRAEHLAANIVSEDKQHIRGFWRLAAGYDQEQNGGHGGNPFEDRWFSHFSLIDFCFEITKFFFI